MSHRQIIISELHRIPLRINNNNEMKNLILTALLVISVFSVHSQETEKRSKKELKAEKKAQQMEVIKAIAESQNFVFSARNATPMSGRSLNLTSEYIVKVTNDSIFSYLPYQGMSHSAVFGGTESPMIFSQPIETYKIEETKNGYMVKLSVNNRTDNLNFSFHISQTRLTNLSVSSINRQPMSYSGEVFQE